MEDNQKKRRSEQIAKRRLFRRTLVLMVVFGVATFGALLGKLWNLQITRHDELEQQAVEQQTSTLTISAPRGTIYDSNENVLAISSTAYDIIISPRAIVQKQQELDQQKAAAEEANNPDNPASQYDVNVEDLVVTGMASILGLDEADVRERCQDTNSQYKRLAQKVDADTEEQVRNYIEEHDLAGCIYLQPNTKRYYPYSTLASQIIGFANDNGGASGVELTLDEDLTGENGLVVTAQDGDGTDLLNFFQDYYDAQAGSDVHLTIDTNIQTMCESILAEGIERYNVLEGGFAIALDCDTGAVLGMASSPNYDLNNYSTVIDTTLLAGVDEAAQAYVDEGMDAETAQQQAMTDAVYTQWRNKAINDTYEPGSTFKTLVLSAALEEGVVSESDHFYCSGVKQVANWPIRCSKREGHGDQTLRQAVMNSCNPAFIEIGQRLGAEKFWEYLENYGLMERTGIDLQGEGQSQFWDEEEFVSEQGIASLATASFGQRFQITPIQMITAACAAVNGGRLMQPYVVQSITDSDGNVIQSAQPTQVRQVISEATSAQVRSILGSVVMDGGTGKNAYQAGYSIGGKTGTSETNQSKTTGRLIVSFLGVAPAENPQIVVLLGYDHPKPAVPGSNLTAGGYYISGGNMAAPMAGELIADILDYLGVEKQYKADELADVVVPKVTELSLNDAQDLLKQKGLQWRTVGEGGVVTDQIPAQGASIPGSSQVVLYLGAEKPTDQVPVPDVSGKTLESAQTAFAKVGLYLRPSGSGGSYSSSSTVAVGQSITAGAMVDPGTVVDVQFIDTDIQDYANNTGIR